MEYSEDDMLYWLDHISNLQEGPISIRDFQKHRKKLMEENSSLNIPDVSTIEKYIGWNAAKGRLGLEILEKDTKFTEEYMLACIEAIAVINCKAPTQNEYEKIVKELSEKDPDLKFASYGTIEQNIGWSNALKKLGFEPRNKFRKMDEHLSKEVKDLIVYVKEGDLEKALEKAEFIDTQLDFGEKAYAKIKLLEGLGLESGTTGSLEGIILNMNYLENELNVNVKKAVKRNVHVLGYDLEKNIKPTIDYLINEVGVKEKDINKIIEKHSPILGVSIENKIKPNIEFILNELKVSNKKIGVVVSANPSMLTSDIENQLMPKTKYLRELGVIRLDKVAIRAPAYFSLNIEDNVKFKIEYLKNDLGLNEKELSKVIENVPSCLTSNIETLKDRIKYVEDWGIQDIRNFVVKAPYVFIGDMEETIRPKYEAILDRFSLEDLEGMPNAIGYSLENRIIPRFLFLENMGINPKGCALSYVLTPTNETFSRKFSSSESSYNDFCKENEDIIKKEIEKYKSRK